MLFSNPNVILFLFPFNASNQIQLSYGSALIACELRFSGDNQWILACSMLDQTPLKRGYANDNRQDIDRIQ